MKKRALDIWYSYGIKNCKERMDKFVTRLVEEWKNVGSALIWEVKNNEQGVSEVWILPSHRVIPKPANVDFPNGYYEFIGDKSYISSESVRRIWA